MESMLIPLLRLCESVAFSPTLVSTHMERVAVWGPNACDILHLLGGHMAGSLAVVTDAAHLLTDLTSFLLSLFSLWLSSKPPSKRLTFGWHRAGTVHLRSIHGSVVPQRQTGNENKRGKAKLCVKNPSEAHLWIKQTRTGNMCSQC